MTMTVRTVAGLAAASALLAACSATVDTGGAATRSTPAGTVRETTRYADNGVKFEYPASWTTIENTTATGSTGSSIWSQGFGPGTSAADVAIVSAYQLKLDVSNVPSQELKGEIDATLDRVAQQAGGHREGDLSAARLGSLQGYTATIDARSPGGQAVQSQVFLAFDHATEYYLNCQYQPPSRTEILAGCERIRSTFTVG